MKDEKLIKVKLGEVGVDSGTIMIVDPCYMQKGEQHDAFEKQWDDLVHGKDRKRWDKTQLNHAKGHTGLGVISAGFGGDGSYDVFAEKSKTGLVKRIIIEFNE